MDLLTTVLRTLDAEDYIENFRKHQIDSFTLKLLSEDDLVAIGIDDEEKRKKLLEGIEKMQIPSEQKINRSLDNQYSKLFLSHCQVQLHKHYSNLICALKREDVDLCEMRLTPVISTLQDSLDSLDKELDHFSQEVINLKPKRQKVTNILLPTVAVTFLALFLCRCYVVYNRQ